MQQQFPFPPIEQLVQQLRDSGAARFAAEWGVPVLVRRPDRQAVVEETRSSFHTEARGSVAAAEEALRRARAVSSPGVSATSAAAARLYQDDPEIRVDDVVPLRKRANATTFGDRIGIGRAANMDVCVPLPRISKYHAYVVATEGGVVLCDARSTFGTFVEGERLEPLAPRTLADGARIELGPYAFRFHTAAGLEEYVARLDRLRS